jgi:hypothetical protein
MVGPLATALRPAQRLALGPAVLAGWWQPLVARFATDQELRRRILTGLSAVGYGLGLAALVSLIRLGAGGLAFDAHSYWLAGRNVLAGQPLYADVAIDALGAYRYPPLFAQLWAPFSLLPPLAFAWFWRATCIVSLRYLAGSWRNVGLWLIVPLTLTELAAANVTFQVAALTLMALRGRAGLAPWAAALKIGPLVVLPYLWLRRPAERKRLLLGLALLAAACGLSVFVAPGYWAAYVVSMGWQSGSALQADGLLALLPTPTLDFAARASLALVLIGVAVWRRSDALAYAATIIAAPTLWMQRLVPLLATPRLAGDRASAPDASRVQAALHELVVPLSDLRPEQLQRFGLDRLVVIGGRGARRGLPGSRNQEDDQHDAGDGQQREAHAV